VEEMLTMVSGFRQDIERGLPDAEKQLEDYMQEQKRRVEHVQEVCYLLSRKFWLVR
jgi:hypothetical protein